MVTPENDSMTYAELNDLRHKLEADAAQGLFTGVFSEESHAVSSPHAHAGATLLTLEGSADIRLDGGIWQTTRPGDVVVINDDQLHEVKVGSQPWKYLFATTKEEARRQGLID